MRTVKSSVVGKVSSTGVSMASAGISALPNSRRTPACCAGCRRGLQVTVSAISPAGAANGATAICGDSASATALLYIVGTPGASLRSRSEYRPIPQPAIAPASAAFGSCTRNSRSLLPASGDRVWLLSVRAFSKIALTPSACSRLPVSSSSSPRRAAGNRSDSAGRTPVRLGPAPANATGPRSPLPRLSTGSAARVATSDSISTTET